ncbi:flagellar assembly protein FliW [bacterium]|nr:flagellar assembly protein FliW [bacterium]
MVQIKTTRFGDMEIDEDRGFRIVGGLLGFPNSTRFILFEHDEESPFKWLQSMDEAHVAFVVTQPLVFFPDYRVHIRKEELSQLGTEDINDAEIMVICSLHSQIHEMTANLQGPIVVNVAKRVGRQMVLKDSTWKTKHPLFPKSA